MFCFIFYFLQKGNLIKKHISLFGFQNKKLKVEVSFVYFAKK